jgi:hypothetical protein
VVGIAVEGTSRAAKQVVEDTGPSRVVVGTTRDRPNSFRTTMEEEGSCRSTKATAATSIGTGSNSTLDLTSMLAVVDTADSLPRSAAAVDRHLTNLRLVATVEVDRHLSDRLPAATVMAGWCLTTLATVERLH